MSMLSLQARELRTMADKLRGVRFDDRANYIENVETLYLSMVAMREAADTIESLRDRLQESYGQVSEQAKRENGGERESYAPPLDALLRCLENDYGIRASWDGLRRVWLTESVPAELDYIEDKSRWFELFGTPERAARTWIDYFGGFIRCADCPCCHDEYGETCELPPKICAWVDEEHGYDALVGWLRGDAE